LVIIIGITASKRMNKSRNSPSLTARLLSDLKDSSRKLSFDESRLSSKFPFHKSPSTLGRETQIQMLNNIFRRILESHESETVMMYGPSGIGKSTLANSFLHSLPPEVLVARGKFDQLRCRVPYSALVTMSENLCRQILRQENSTEIREKIRATLGAELSLLGTLLPTLAQINEDNRQFMQSEREQSSSSSNRFKQGFRTFLRCVASEENPVVFFVDDIQWADISSLEILESLINDPLSRNILIICAYRDDESSSEIFRIFCESIHHNLKFEHNNHRVTAIQVDRLKISDLNRILAARLSLNLAEVQSLGSLIWNKTNGNPFYASHFLNMLYSTGMLSRKLDDSWTWDETQILLQTNVADNLLQILKNSLERIPNQARSILQIASFIGYEFSLHVLTTILFHEQDMIETEYSFNRMPIEKIHNQINVALKIACSEGLLETDSETKGNVYKFAHDTIRQVLYEDLMPDLVERQLLHQRIGVLIYEAIKSGQASDDMSIFLAANNLSFALNPCMNDSDVTNEILCINFLAGKAAVRKSDFPLASEYLQTAIRVIESNDFWKSKYDLCIEIYTLCAEVEMVNANYTISDACTKEISNRAESWLDKCSAFQIQIKCLAG
jgi:predicted ATPase